MSTTDLRGANESPAQSAAAQTLLRVDGLGKRFGGFVALENISLAVLAGERLGLSTGAVSMLLTEMQEWGAVKKAWVVGERREHYEAETSIWKMVSRVFRERELVWIRTAQERFEVAAEAFAPTPDARGKLIAERIAGLAQLAQVGARLLEAVLQGESVDALPIKTVGELAKAVRDEQEP